MPHPQSKASTKDERVMQVFLTALDACGGPRSLVERHRASWLPHLMESSYIVVLQEDDHKNPEEIANILDISVADVENVLGGPVEGAMQRVKEAPPESMDECEDIAGGVARYAYGVVHHNEMRPL